MLSIGNKKYRNLQEQVSFNSEQIDKIFETLDGLNVQDNVVYVSNGYGTEKQYGNSLHLDEMHFISGNPWNNFCKSVDITFKNRHMPEFIPGKLTHLGNSEYVIEIELNTAFIAIIAATASKVFS